MSLEILRRRGRPALLDRQPAILRDLDQKVSELAQMPPSEADTALGIAPDRTLRKVDSGKVDRELFR